MKATVMIPTHHHAPLLPYSIPSALNQTVRNIEIFIIGDGVDDRSRQIIHEFRAKDSRIQFFDHPKDKRRGEVYRNQALQQAQGEIVCYLCDDEIWLPEHIETMQSALQNADFAAAFPISISPDKKITLHSEMDISVPRNRTLMLDGKASLVSLSCAAHTLAYYRKLPFGWRRTPEKVFTDLYMWQQFLAQPDCRAVRAARPTVLNFPSFERNDWINVTRAAELAHWSSRIETKEGREQLLVEVMEILVRNSYRQAEDLNYLKNSKPIRLKNFLQKISGRSSS